MQLSDIILLVASFILLLFLTYIFSLRHFFVCHPNIIIVFVNFAFLLFRKLKNMQKKQTDMYISQKI